MINTTLGPPSAGAGGAGLGPAPSADSTAKLSEFSDVSFVALLGSDHPPPDPIAAQNVIAAAGPGTGELLTGLVADVDGTGATAILAALDSGSAVGQAMVSASSSPAPELAPALALGTVVPELVAASTAPATVAKAAASLSAVPTQMAQPSVANPAQAAPASIDAAGQPEKARTGVADPAAEVRFTMTAQGKLAAESQRPASTPAASAGPASTPAASAGPASTPAALHAQSPESAPNAVAAEARDRREPSERAASVRASTPGSPAAATTTAPPMGASPGSAAATATPTGPAGMHDGAGAPSGTAVAAQTLGLQPTTPGDGPPRAEPAPTPSAGLGTAPSGAAASARGAGAGLPLASPFELAEELGARIRLAVREGGRELTVSLRPPELGHLLVRVTVQEGAMQAQILAERPEAARLLSQALPHLAAALAALGYDVDNLDISYRDADEDAAGGQNAGPGSGAEGRAASTNGDANVSTEGLETPTSAGAAQTPSELNLLV